MKPVCNQPSFRLEARSQIVCAVCQKPGKPFQSHHVVDKAILKSRCGLRGNALYDTRNALRLCQSLGDPNCRCHFQHENSRRLVKTSELRDENIEYAFEKLEGYAPYYLRREYDDSDPDPRITKAERELEARLAA